MSDRHRRKLQGIQRYLSVCLSVSSASYMRVSCYLEDVNVEEVGDTYRP